MTSFLVRCIAQQRMRVKGMMQTVTSSSSSSNSSGVRRRWMSTQLEIENAEIPKKVSQTDLQIAINGRLARVASGKELLDTLSGAENAGWKSNYLTYSAAIGRAVALSDMGGAEALLQRMGERSIKCDTSLYNVLLDGYARLGDTPKMLAVRRRMRADGAVLDLSSYCTLIYGHARANEDVAARDLIDEIRSVGLPARSASPWNALMAGHAVAHRQREIEHAFDSMVAAGIAPDADSYATCVRVAVHAKDYGGALKQLLAMWENDVPRPSALYVELVQSMQVNPRECDPSTLLKVLQMVAKERNIAEAQNGASSAGSTSNKTT